MTAGMVPLHSRMWARKYILDWFVERNFDAFNVDRYNSYELSFDDRPNNLQHSHFLIGMFKAIMDHMEKRGTAPLVNVIITGINGVLFEMGGDRWGTSRQNDFVVVDQMVA